MIQPNYSDKYWLCDACALEKGAKLTEGVCTVIKGLCGHCNSDQESILTPWVDYDWPQDKLKNMKARLNRD